MTIWKLKNLLDDYDEDAEVMVNDADIDSIEFCFDCDCKLSTVQIRTREKTA